MVTATPPNPKIWLEDFFRSLSGQKPPQWLLDEAQQRLVLFLNHVLQQEPKAMQRIKRQSGRSVQLNWRDFQFEYVFTPAGLLESRPATDKAADLILSVKEDSPLELFRLAVSGQRPSVRIEGDVQLAAEVNWLVEHVRWDPEEDLARIFGDTTAHILADFGRNAITALKKFVQSQRREPSTTPHHQDHS